MDKEELNKILDKFLKDEGWKTRGGSGDDQFYVDQLEAYVNKQRQFWLNAIETFMGLGREQVTGRVLHYKLLNKQLKVLPITISPEAKDIFMVMIGWDEAKFEKHTIKIYA